MDFYYLARLSETVSQKVSSDEKVLRLREMAGKIPEKPGIYMFFSKEGEIIYIGKSINLRKRVTSYFTGTKKGKILSLVKNAGDIAYMSTDTHLEARIIECMKIKELKPRYNSQFRRDKASLCLYPAKSYRGEALIISSEGEGGFFPCRSVRVLKNFSRQLSSIYPLIKKDRGDGYTFSYRIIPERMNPSDFNINRESLKEIFYNEESLALFIENLKDKMYMAADREHFSEAIFMRDLIEEVKRLIAIQEEERKLITSEFILSVPLDKGIKRFFIKDGLIRESGISVNLDNKDFKGFDEKWNYDSFSSDAIGDFIKILLSEIRELPKEYISFKNTVDYG